MLNDPVVSTRRLARGPVRQEPPEERIGASGDDLGTNDFADAIEAPFDLNRLEIGRLAGDLARVPARFFNQHVERAPGHFAIECLPLSVEERLKPGEPLRLDGLGDLISHFGRAGLFLPVGDAFKYFLPFPSVIYLRPSWWMHSFACFTVFLVTLLATLPPALRAGRLKPAEALRHV